MYRLDCLDNLEDDKELRRRDLYEERREQFAREEHERRQEVARQDAERYFMNAKAEEWAQEQYVLSSISGMLNKKMTTMTEEEFVAWISGLYLKHGQSLFFEGLSLSYILSELAIWRTNNSKFGTIGYSPLEELSRLFNTKTLDMFCFEDEDDYKIKA